MKKNIIIIYMATWFLMSFSVPSSMVCLEKEHVDNALKIPVLHRLNKKQFADSLVGQSFTVDQLLVFVQQCLSEYWIVQRFAFDNKRVAEVAVLTTLLKGHPHHIKEIHEKYALQKRI